MNAKYSPRFLDKLKKQNVRIRKSFKEALKEFEIDPNNPALKNHALKREWNGCRSIDITSDWRAIYKKIQEGKEVVAYFIALGTHEELYEPIKN